MVAGGVHSVEGDPYEGYAPPSSYHEQVYSTTFSNNTDNVNYKHDKCTCPSTPQSKKGGSFSLSSDTQINFNKHPKCTCPTPPSFPSSPAESPPPSPIFQNLSSSCGCSSSTQNLNQTFLTQPTFRHPKCTCPTPPPIVPLRPTLKCTCPSKHQNMGLHKKNVGARKIVRAMLWDAPDKSPILSTDNKKFVQLHHTQNNTHVSGTPTVTPVKQKKTRSSSYSQAIFHNSNSTATLHSSSDNDLEDTGSNQKNNSSNKKRKGKKNISANHTPSEEKSDVPVDDPKSVSSPAGKVKEKLSNFRQKIVTSFIKNSDSKFQDSNDTGGFGEQVVVAGIACSNDLKNKQPINNSTDNKIENISMKWLVPSEVIRTMLPSSSSIDNRNDDTSNFNKSGSFCIDELPSPIVNDLKSPLGTVPPLSPPNEKIYSAQEIVNSPSTSSQIHSSKIKHSTGLRNENSFTSDNISYRSLPLSYKSNFALEKPNVSNSLKITKNSNLPSRGNDEKSDYRREVIDRKFQKRARNRALIQNPQISTSMSEKNRHSQSLIDINALAEMSQVLNDILGASYQDHSDSSSSPQKYTSDDRRKSITKASELKYGPTHGIIHSRVRLQNEQCILLKNSPYKKRPRPYGTHSLVTSPVSSRPSSRSSYVASSVSDKNSPCSSLPVRRKVLKENTRANSLRSVHISKKELDLLKRILEKTKAASQQELDAPMYRTRSLDVKNLDAKTSFRLNGDDPNSSTSSSIRSRKSCNSDFSTLSSPQVSRSISLKSSNKRQFACKQSHIQDNSRESFTSQADEVLPPTPPPKPKRIIRTESTSTLPLPRSKYSKNKYENVVFHEAGDYIMLSKQIMDQWELPYEFTYPSIAQAIAVTHANTQSVLTFSNSRPCMATANKDLVHTGVNLSLNKKKLYANDYRRKLSSTSGSSTPTTPTLLGLAEKHVGGLAAGNFSLEPRRLGK